VILLFLEVGSWCIHVEIVRTVWYIKTIFKTKTKLKLMYAILFYVVLTVLSAA